MEISHDDWSKQQRLVEADRVSKKQDEAAFEAFLSGTKNLKKVLQMP